MAFLGASISFMHDLLSIFFVFLIILVVIPILIYSAGYIKEYRNHYSLKYLWVMMGIFILSMIGVVLSSNSIAFMVFWEIMSISSFFLVIYEYKNKENLKSGVMYFIMTHISGLILMAMFALIGRYSGSMNFERIMSMAPNFSISQKLVIFLLALIGFGAKAGLVPLHAWLPKAHPSAPSNISALMSGVMIKIAVYGFIRVIFMFPGKLPWEYGIIVMATGTLTALFSAFNAIFQDDIKKLLAYSSSENIGIIFGTLGLSMVLGSYGFMKLQVITLAAALFHVLNHAVFKSLLFSGAGSVLYATSTKNMNELGGLYRKMKFAACCTFIGTAAISAVPPFNGFASEILIFKSFIESGADIKYAPVVLMVVLCGILLAMTGGAVIYSAVKSFGMTYIGEARSEKAERIHAIPVTMNLGMGILAFAALVLGVFSPYALGFISHVAEYVSGSEGIGIGGFGFFEPIVISVILALVTIIVLLINKLGQREGMLETNATWGCGFNEFKPHMQYTGSGFSHPAARISGFIAGYRKEAKVKDTVYLRQRTNDIIEKYIYSPVIEAVDYISGKIIKIHYGRIQLYISYLFISLIIALVMVIKFV